MKIITPLTLIFFSCLLLLTGPTQALLIDNLPQPIAQSLPKPDNILLTSKKEIPRHIWIANQYLKKAQFDIVVNICQQIISLDKENIEAHALLAAAFKGQGKEEKFNNESAQLKKLAPDTSLFFQHLATVYLTLDQLTKAELTYKQGIQSSAEKTILRMELASLYVNQKKPNKAYQQYQMALQTNGISDQHFINASFALCRIDLQEREYERAITQANSIIDRYPILPHGYRCLADSQLKKGNHQLAIDSYKKLMRANPSSPEPLQELALIYSENIKDQKKAIQYAEQGAQKFHQNAKSQDVLGWIYFNSKDYQKAIIQFRQAANLDENNTSYHYHLGLCYQEQGQTALATAAFKNALKLADEQQQQALGNELRRRINLNK